MDELSRIYVAGHNGLVGSAILRALRARDYSKIIAPSHDNLELTDASAVESFFARERPEYVFMAAAKVGGIMANSTYPADFIRINLQIQTNLIDASYRHGVKRLLFLGSSCIYPKFAQQPMREEYLLTGELEPTSEPYAVAKIAGLTMCRAYRRQYGFDAVTLMPNNLYGPGDNFDLETSHVLSALLRKFHEAKLAGKPEVEIWGSGKPRREFLHVDDLADACIFVIEQDEKCLYECAPDNILNVGTGKDITISQLAEVIGEVTGFEGKLGYDPGKPDGVPRKLLDVSRMEALGWKAKTLLEEGIVKTYAWFVENFNQNDQP